MATALLYLFLVSALVGLCGASDCAAAFVFGRVNPLSEAFRFFSIPACGNSSAESGSSQGKWFVFSDSVVDSGFLRLHGAQVYGSYRYLPDIDHFRVFAANHLDLEILNRDGYLDAHLRGPRNL